MAVQNGQPVNAQVTNAAFVSKTQDSDTIGKIGLKNTDVISGANVNNTQRAINKAFEGVGATGEADTTINTYSSNNYITNGDNRKVATGKLDTQLFTTQTQLAALDLINSQDISLAPVGIVPNANGVTITPDQILNLQPADATNPGVMTAVTQSLGGNKTFTGNVTVSGNESVTGTLAVTGATTLSSSSVTGNETIGGTLAVTGASTLSSLGVTGSATVAGTLGVTGLSTLGSASITNNQTIGGTLTVAGNTTLNGNLTVNGTTTTVNSTTISTADKNIEINQGGNDAASEGAGLTTKRTGTSGSLIYRNTSATRHAVGDLGSEVDIVGTTSIQTLTNKTLTAPAITSPTGITKTDVGLANVDNTSDVTKNSAIATLTNKTISGAANTITNVSLTTGVTGTLPIGNGGTGQVTAIAAFGALSPNTTKGDITVHNGTNSVRLPVGTDGQGLIVDSAQAAGVKWGAVASSSSGGGVANLITDGNAESGITNYIEGSYAAATRPAGTFTASSGAGSFSISTSTTNPISGPTSFLLTKSSGASRQGRAVERTITLDREYQTKSLQMRIKFSVVSGSFVAGTNGTTPTDSSAIFYIGEFNGTTWTYTEPSNFKALSASSIVDYIPGSFQVKSDTTQIKLISYVAETANSAWVLQCEFEISPSVYVYGSPVTDWQTFTPTGSFTTNTTYTGRFRRVGDSMEVQTNLAFAGATNAANLDINLPAGFSIDAAKIPGVTAFSSSIDGMGVGSQGATRNFQVVYNTTTAVRAAFQNTLAGGVTSVTDISPATIAAGQNMSFTYRVPILGWSSSVQMSDGFDGRSVVFSGAVSSQALTANVTLLTATSVVRDDVSSYTTGVLNVRTAGDYVLNISASFNISPVGLYYTLNNTGATFVVTMLAGTNNVSVGAVLIPNLKAGDTIRILSSANVTVNNAFYYFYKLSGSATISATESVNLAYSSNTGQSFVNLTSTILSFPTRDYDTHGAWNGTTFTAPIAGKYRISLSLQFNAAIWNALTRGTTQVFKNGVLLAGKALNSTYSINSTATYVLGLNGGSTEVSLIGGDQITLRLDQNSGITQALLVDTTLNHVEISKVGN